MRTLRRHIKEARSRGLLYEEEHKAPGRTGPPAKYMDVMTLGLNVAASRFGTYSGPGQVGTHSDKLVPQISANLGNECQVAVEASSTEKNSLAFLPATSELVPQKLALIPANECQPDALAVARYDPSLLIQAAGQVEYRDTDLTAARDLYAALLPILETRAGSHERGQQIRALAEARQVDQSTVREWLHRFQQEGLSGLQPKPRQDRGAFRVPQETLQLICAAIITNPPTTSPRQIHDTLTRAVPDAMLTRRAGGLHFVSVATVARIRDTLLAHPQMRVLLMNADARKEFLRTYVGRVIAASANDLWEQDMTRCDILIYDEETGQFYRPRVQAIIDVFSGCIPGIGFSPDENQVQADLAFFRAILKPAGPLAAHFPVYGKPRRLYIDNGKTYTSEHFERVARELGIELIHSKPYVSHTRGHIERFFGTLHRFEKTLPGYVGADAVSRGTLELEKLTEATKRWIETGRDPGEGKRLLTLREYQSAVLRWLAVDYHQHIVNGKTRLDWFTSTAPASSLIQFDLGELLVHFAHRVERVVRPDCTVQVDNTLWACMDGALGSYAGTRVLVLRDAMVLGDDVRIIARRERNGNLRILGAATRAPDNALSVEAGVLRRANKLSKRETLTDMDEFAAQATDPAFLVRKQHELALPEQPVSSLPPTARGRITAINPEPMPDLGNFGKSFLRGDEPTDMDTFLKSLQEEE